MAENTRLRRIGEQMRAELSAMLRDAGTDDARLPYVSITHIDVARDLSHSKIFITYIGEVDDRVEVVDLLNDLAGPFRYELSQTMKLRTVPTLNFVYDESIERGAELQRKIEKLNNTDQ